MTNKSQFIKSSGNVFHDLGFNDIEARELQLRSSLMLLLNKHIQQNELNQAQAAKILGVTQPRVSNLMSGKVDLFSTSMLLAMLEKAGFNIYEKIDGLLKKAA